MRLWEKVFLFALCGIISTVLLTVAIVYSFAVLVSLYLIFIIMGQYNLIGIMLGCLVIWAGTTYGLYRHGRLDWQPDNGPPPSIRPIRMRAVS